MESNNVHENEYALSLGQLCVQDGQAGYVSPCVYCGMPADSVDHVPPRYIRAQLAQVELKPVTVVEVPACRECNCALGARPLLTVGHRRAWIKDWLKRRYRTYLNIPNWTEEELAEFGEGLRGKVRRGMAIRDTVRERIQWPNVYVKVQR